MNRPSRKLAYYFFCVNLFRQDWSEGGAALRSGVRGNSQRTRALRWGAHPDRRGRRPLVTGERGAVTAERGATAGHRGAVIGWRGAITGERGAVPPSPAGRSCFFNEESPNEVPDDYHVLNDVWNGPSRTFHINAYDSHLDQWFTNHLYEISGGADLVFFLLLAALHGRPESKGFQDIFSYGRFSSINFQTNRWTKHNQT